MDTVIKLAGPFSEITMFAKEQVVLPMPPNSNQEIHRLFQSFNDDSNKEISKITVIQNLHYLFPNDTEKFTENQIDQLFDLAILCRDNSITNKVLLKELRAGGMKEQLAGCAGLMLGIIILLNNIKSNVPMTNNMNFIQKIVICKRTSEIKLRKHIIK